MSYKSDGSFISRKGTGPAVTQFDTIADLVTASQGGLAPGYYEVVGQWITFWDGAVFNPPRPESSVIVTPDGGLLDFETIAQDANTVLLLAPSAVWPGIRDYAGTYTDEELCTATYTPLPAREARGLFHGAGYARKTQQFAHKSALRILGDVVFRTAFRVLDTMASSVINISDFGSGGSSEPTNSLWNMNASRTTLETFQESGAGVDAGASWYVPGTFRAGKEWLCELRRESDVTTAWINGLQLNRVTVTGGTSDAEGAVTLPTPTGGNDSLLCNQGFCEYDYLDAYFLHVCDAADTTKTAAEFAAGKFGWTASEINDLTRDDHEDLAALPSAVVVLEPELVGLVDRVGTIDYTADWEEGGGAQTKLIDGVVWSDLGYRARTTRAIPELVITGDLTIKCLFIQGSTLGRLTEYSDHASTAEAGNFVFLLSTETSGRTRFLHENQPGVGNVSVYFVGDEWVTGEIYELHLRRDDIGGGNSELRCWRRPLGGDWVALLVDSQTHGTGTGTAVATIPSTSGGTSTGSRFHVTSTRIAGNLAASGIQSIRQLAIFNDAMDPT